MFIVSACSSTPQTIRTEWKVIKPSAAMYECPLLTKWPNPDQLTDVQVAKTLVKLYKNNVKCKNSINAIEKFLEKAQRRIEGIPEPTEQVEEQTIFGIF